MKLVGSKTMTAKGIVIEQMFEDMPSVLTSTDIPTTASLQGQKPRRPSNATDLSKEKRVSISEEKRSSYLPSDIGTNLRSSVGTPNTKRKSIRQLSSDRDREQNERVDKITPAQALAAYRDKLSFYEQEEILGFPDVYYLGLDARKHGFQVETPVKKANDVFDDAEHFYKVIKAYDHKYQKAVALKIVRNEKSYLRQSREELRILQELYKQDPRGNYNVVTFHEFFIFRNHMVICFELLGMNLYQVLKLNKFRGLSMSQIRPIARSILKCLELLLKNRIIHCDIKPENIMLRRNGDFRSIKVGDFGSSCYEQQQVYRYIQSRYYRAPEVILGMRYGPAIDMWSFGCVLCELSTGTPVFVGHDEFDQLAAFEEYLGEVPTAVLARQKTRKRPALKKNRLPPGTKTLRTVLQGCNSFKEFTLKVLEMDPYVRPTPSEASSHYWLRRSSASPGEGQDRD